jgi:hypothetical protein
VRQLHFTDPGAGTGNPFFAQRSCSINIDIVTTFLYLNSNGWGPLVLVKGTSGGKGPCFFFPFGQEGIRRT